MDPEFGPAALAIYAGDIDQLRNMLAVDNGLATRRSSVSHPTLLQLVAVEEVNMPDPIGAAAALMAAGAATHLPLVSAAGCKSLAVLGFLLDQGVRVDGEDPLWTPVDEALYWAHTDVADLLVARGARVRALSTAAGLGNMTAIEQFVGTGQLTTDAGPIGSPFTDTVPAALASDPTSIIDHAFVMAINCGQQSAASRLLDEGANVNSTPPGYHWRGTPLHAAVWRGDRTMVEWLLSLGSDPEIRDGLANSDALGWARHHGHADLVELFSDDNPLGQETSG